MNPLSLFGLGILMLCLPAFSGCGGKEPSVELYTDMDAAVVKPMVAQWEKEVGIPIRVTYASDAALIEKGVGLSQRIMDEAGYKADVYWGRDAATIEKLVTDGKTDLFNPTALQTFHETCRNKAGNWFALAARVRVIVYNKQAFRGKKPPESLMALTRPEWKNKAALADPRLSGSSLYHLAVLYTAFSDRDADDLVGKIKDNAVQLLPTEAAVIEAVSSGKAAWGVTNSDLAENAAASGKIAYLAVDQADHSTALALDKEAGEVFTLGTPVLPYPAILLKERPSYVEGRKLYGIMTRLSSATLLSKTAPAMLPTHTSLLENPPDARKGRPLNLGKLRLSPAKPAVIAKKQATLIITLNSLFQ
jgi:ABC-type Fe3+ transport system substrate-binding protein